MAKTIQSRKAKGKRAEMEFAKLLRTKGIDKEAKRMVMSGAVDYLKGDIWCPNLPQDSFEVKNQEKVRLWQFWEQAQEQAGNQTPHLIIGGNFRPQLVVMLAEDWANLKKIEKDYYNG